MTCFPNVDEVCKAWCPGWQSLDPALTLSLPSRANFCDVVDFARQARADTTSFASAHFFLTCYATAAKILQSPGAFCLVPGGPHPQTPYQCACAPFLWRFHGESGSDDLRRMRFFSFSCLLFSSLLISLGAQSNAGRKKGQRRERKEKRRT